MNVFTRTSAFTWSSVGPCRFASATVFVFVSARWTFFCSSGCEVSSRRGGGAASAIAEDSSAPGSGFHPQLLEIEVAFDATKDLVADDAALVQIERGAAFRVDDGATHLRMFEQLLLGRAGDVGVM